MFSTVLGELKGYIGSDFVLSIFFPVLIFVALSVALWLKIQDRLGDAIAAWEKLTLQTQGITLISGLTVVATASFMVYSFQYVMVRFFEGYWTGMPILKWFRNVRVRAHR